MFVLSAWALARSGRVEVQEECVAAAVGQQARQGDVLGEPPVATAPILAQETSPAVLTGLVTAQLVEAVEALDWFWFTSREADGVVQLLPASGFQERAVRGWQGQPDLPLERGALAWVERLERPPTRRP